MPDPLPSDIVARLKSDPTAALAAALILAGSFPELLAWAQRTIVPPAAKTNGGSNGASHDKPRKATGARATSPHGGERRQIGPRAKRNTNPREAAAKHDQALLALMRANPGASVTEIIRMNGRPRNSTALSLDRLEKAGLVEHARRGKWTVVDPDLLDPRTSGSGGRPAGWIEPLSANRKARHAADGRVRDELTMAAS